MLIDVHGHLSDTKYEGREEEIAASFGKKEPFYFIDNATDGKDAEEVFLRSQRYERVYCAVGVHPEYADRLTDENLTRFAEMAKNEKVVAIGETGLDYYHPTNPPKEVEKESFVKQIELAHEVKLPIIVHIRDAHGDTLKILQENKNKLEYGLLIHCYSGSKEMLVEYDRLNAYYSFGGVVTYKNAKDKPDVLRAIRPDRLLLETDCPYMTPVPFRGQTNYPEYIEYTARKIAEFTGKTYEQIEKETTENAKRLFTKLKI